MAASVRRASRLRGQVEQLEREHQGGLVGRALELLVDAVTLVLLLVLIVDGVLAYRAFHDHGSATESQSLSSSSLHVSATHFVEAITDT